MGRTNPPISFDNDVGWACAVAWLDLTKLLQQQSVSTLATQRARPHWLAEWHITAYWELHIVPHIIEEYLA